MNIGPTVKPHQLQQNGPLRLMRPGPKKPALAGLMFHSALKTTLKVEELAYQPHSPVGLTARGP